MNKLIIGTHFPSTVASLLKAYDLVEGLPHTPAIGATEDLEVYYPDDAISQALEFWLTIARACGLINSYKLIMPWMEEFERKRTQKEGSL